MKRGLRQLLQIELPGSRSFKRIESSTIARMDHFQAIYQHHAAQYHQMISAEDARSHLPAVLKAITPFQGKRVVDIGSGTGRIPIIFQNEPAQMVALDAERAMLLENKIQRDQNGGRWHLVQGDGRSLPFASGWADITIAGWAFGHFRSWYPEGWQEQIGAAFSEMFRITRPGGYLIILETLGTGSWVPRAPSLELSEYYNWMEDTWELLPQEVRTDYQFESVEQAVSLTEFFFGSDLANLIREKNWTHLPEWTGVWSRRKSR